MTSLPLFAPLSPAEKKVVEENSIQEILPSGTEVLKEGQFVNLVPIVISGLIKVSTRKEDKEMMLYYIRPGEACVMSYLSAVQSEPSKVYATTEETTEVGFLPRDLLRKWTVEFPSISKMFLHQYHQCYLGLLDTVSDVIFDKIETRLIRHLDDLTKLKNKNPIKVSHRQLASELGTAREVVSRALKKLEIEGRLNLSSAGIFVST
jgi:CRP/FNR family transcriptional regulator